MKSKSVWSRSVVLISHWYSNPIITRTALIERLKNKLKYIWKDAFQRLEKINQLSSTNQLSRTAKMLYQVES